MSTRQHSLLSRHPVSVAMSIAVLSLMAVALLTLSPSADATSTAPADTTSSAPSAANVDLALLTITVTTNSAWTKVHLTPAVVRNMAVANNPAAVSTAKINDGVVLNAVPRSGATVAFHVLAEDLTGAPSFNVTVEKGAVGTTTATIVNTSSTPFTAAQITDTASSTATNPANIVLDRSQLFGTVEPALPHADPRHLVLAFYYGWYGVGSFSSPRMFDQPASGPYSATDPNAVMNMTTQARANGIDGFVMSWSGDANSGPQFDVVLQAARATNGYATGYLETLQANPTRDATQPADPAVAEAWLDQLLTRSSDPAFLTSDGIPVVFVYGMYRLPVSAWSQILDDEAAAGHPVRLVGDGSLPAYAGVMWGSHQYNPNPMSYDTLSNWNHGRLVAQRGQSSVDSTVAPKLYAATVSPGFDNTRAKLAAGLTGTSVDRGSDGQRYQLTWDAALRNDPDWVLVTTWNEWYEGTAIQPGKRTGSLALTQTKANAENF